METELTRTIKRRLHSFRPAMSGSMRTVRWADEVAVGSGYVDVIRFEDYIARDDSYCVRLSPTPDDKKHPMFRPENEGLCKFHSEAFPGAGAFPSTGCRACVYKRTRHELGILTTCFEVKISVSDFKSKNGHNFYGNRNYYAVPANIADKIALLLPPAIGLVVYYPDSGRMATKIECEHKAVTPEDLSYMLYNALKKWVDLPNSSDKQLPGFDIAFEQECVSRNKRSV